MIEKGETSLKKKKERRKMEKKERKGKEREKIFLKKIIIAFVTVPLFTHAKLFGI